MIKMMDSNMSSISSCFCYSTWKESALPALIWIGFEFWTMVRLKNKNHVFTTPILLLWWLVSVDLEFQVIWCQPKSNALKLITYKLKPSLKTTKPAYIKPKEFYSEFQAILLKMPTLLYWINLHKEKDEKLKIKCNSGYPKCKDHHLH